MRSLDTKSKLGYGNMDLGDGFHLVEVLHITWLLLTRARMLPLKSFRLQKTPQSVCILSAIGVISHVTLRHASSSVGTVTYEGRFEILSLSGSFTPGEFGVLSQETKMSITLSSPDGRVVGGQLGGLLAAAGPVQNAGLIGLFAGHKLTG